MAKDFFAEDFEQDFFAEDFESAEKGLTGAGKVLPTFISGQTPERGERTLLGNIFERPAAASREAIRAKPGLGFTGPLAGLVAQTGLAGQEAKEASTRGSLIPEESETFQSEAIRKAQTSTSVLENIVRGMRPSARGLAKDILTSPGDVLLELATLGGAKGVKAVELSSKAAKADKAVSKLLPKAISPTVKGRKSAKQIAKFEKQSKSAVNSIIDNKDNITLVGKDGIPRQGELPKNVREFSQAIEQTKTPIFNEYDELIKRAGKQGNYINQNKVVGELDDIINDDTLSLTNPEVVSYARSWKNKLLRREAGEVVETPTTILSGQGKPFISKSVTPGKKMTLTEADKINKSLNRNLDAYYNNITLDTHSRAWVDALIKNNLTKQLDDITSTLDGVADGSFKALKSRYSALRAIEEDVGKKAFQIGRKPNVGLFDFSDVFAGRDVVRGLINQDPSRIVGGASQSTIKAVLKRLNDPDRMVNKLFKKSTEAKNLSKLTNLFPITGTLPASTKALNKE
jgi:hypothetical protein